MNLRTSLMIAMAATWLCGEVWASEFRKGPYLQNVSDASITVMWESSESDPCTVLVLDPESPQTIPAEADDDSMYEVTVSGLASGRRYRYAVECGDERREGEFATAPAAGAPLTFVVFGDTRSNARPHERLVARVRSEVPDFILGTGDMVDDGGREPQWQEFFEIERALLAENVLFPAVGNHDRQGRGRTADNYRKYFAVPENSPDPERYYAFTYAGARFIVLDSNAYSFSLTDQTAWLESQLRASEIDPAIDHVFVAMHHPPFSISLHGGQRELRERWTPLFEQYGVTAVFSGHDHVYSRAEHGGVRYFVSGGGGAPLYPRSRRPSPIDRKAVKYFERVSHYLRVHIIGTYVEISAIRADGSLIEAVSWGQPSKKQDNDPAGVRPMVANPAPPSLSPAVARAVGAPGQPPTAPSPSVAEVSAPTGAQADITTRRFGPLGLLGAMLIIFAGGVLVWTLRS